MVRAVTFDFWDTIVVDDSDEPKRAAAGMPAKSEARRQLFVAEVLAHHPEVGEAAAAAALEAANAWFRHAWKVEHQTPSLDARLFKGFEELGLGRTPGFDAMVEAYASLEVETPPDLAPGIREALETLSGDYKIGIVSDAIVTPGSHLRKVLEHYGLLDYFEVFVFSDEAGASKPDRKVFDVAADGFGCEVAEIVHIGDREYNDIGGPVGCGAMSVLYTGAIDRGHVPTTQATVVCEHHQDLAGLIAAL